MAPLIGITGRRTFAYNMVNAFDRFKDAPIELFYAEYGDKIAAAGANPIWLSDASRPGEVVDRLDGLLLTGGTDVDPARYGRTPGPNLWQLEPERDEFELGLIAAAIERGIPVLGSCRGIQILNVFFGGTLVAHLPSDDGMGHSSTAYPRYVGRHRVTFEPGSVLADLYGPDAMVNSFHHQAVDELGAGLRVVARADDGVIEAVEHESLPVVAVQWHPETMRTLEPVWEWFVKRCTGTS